MGVRGGAACGLDVLQPRPQFYWPLCSDKIVTGRVVLGGATVTGGGLWKGGPITGLSQWTAAAVAGAALAAATGGHGVTPPACVWPAPAALLQPLPLPRPRRPAEPERDGVHAQRHAAQRGRQRGACRRGARPAAGGGCARGCASAGAPPRHAARACGKQGAAAPHPFSPRRIPFPALFAHAAGPPTGSQSVYDRALRCVFGKDDTQLTGAQQRGGTVPPGASSSARRRGERAAPGSRPLLPRIWWQTPAPFSMASQPSIPPSSLPPALQPAVSSWCKCQTACCWRTATRLSRSSALPSCCAASCAATGRSRREGPGGAAAARNARALRLLPGSAPSLCSTCSLVAITASSAYWRCHARVRCARPQIAGASASKRAPCRHKPCLLQPPWSRPTLPRRSGSGSGSWTGGSGATCRPKSSSWGGWQPSAWLRGRTTRWGLPAAAEQVAGNWAAPPS